MRKGFTLAELLIVIVALAVVIFGIWACFWGTPNHRLFLGIGLVIMYLPAVIANLTRGATDGLHCLIVAAGGMLIASKFIF